ncbi:hypothetical protein [Arthrobacter zhaoguopingii]|uniref:hypothetical protein n=1 Tax=Arthrobacter zhaoguopingii TaxID=2681491 RepID=UPI0013574DCB|nr:hypothetical protein [Arthrobacter zhaoguopingii]
MTEAPPDWDIPEDWTAGARDAFLNVVEQRPDLSGAELAGLEQAAALISIAEKLDEAAQGAGLLVLGSTKQLVVNPGVIEARLARTSAASILARLVPVSAGAKTNSQRGREAARARYSAK